MANKKVTFNPVKEEMGDARARRIIWSTDALNAALVGLEQGKKLVANPFYENNMKLLKSDLVFSRTDAEIEEWLKCKDDIVYFAEKYCKLMTPEGIKNVELRGYQKLYLKHLMDNRLSIYLACRQCAKTTTSAIFMLHYILFNTDKNALVLGNKRKTAVEILDKAKKIFSELPFFLRPGIYKWNEAEIVLDNGCRLMAEATTINSGISFTFHCVLADEFAHVAPNIIDKFYNNLFPTITAGKARFMITSTQNGYNLFYRLYKSAEARENEYKPFKTDWWEVPEWDPDNKKWIPRDEKWHKLQVANYGSEEAFNAQFGTDFDVSANTLITRNTLKKNQSDLIEFINKDLYGIELADRYFWHPDYEPMEMLKKDYLVITCDLAEGIGGDYTVFSMHRMVDIETDKLECVGYFRTYKDMRENCTKSLLYLICTYMDQNHILLSYERNTYGELFYRDIYDYMEKIPIISKQFDTSILVKYYNETGTKYNMGVKLTAGNKTTHCLLFKNTYERGKYICNDTKFFNELNNFTDDGTGHYKAAFGHDDIMMTSIQTEFVRSTLQYKILRSEFESNYNAPVQNDNIYNPFEDTLYDLQERDIYSNRLGGYRIM
jgi:hypothetical protein